MIIEDSLRKLTDSRPAGQDGGFVVFNWGDKFLQFALDKTGVAFDWPNPPKSSSSFNFFASRADAVKTVLETLGFEKVKRISKPKEFQEVDGIYAQCGNDVELMLSVTKAMMRDVLQLEDIPPSDLVLELYD